MRRFFLPSLFLFFAGSVSALPPQKLLYPGDWAYDALSLLSRESGIVFFSDSMITAAQMKKNLEQIDAASLSDSGLAIYDRLTAYLESEPWIGFKSDAVSGGLDLLVQPELYAKTSEDVPWIYDYHARNPLLLLPAGFSLGPWAAAQMDINIGQNEYAAAVHDNYINIPLDPVKQFDIHFPKRAYVSAGIAAGEASGLNFTFGLGDNFFGRTRTGSVILSEYLERTVYAQASLYSPAFKYSAQVMQYEVNKYHYMHYFQIRPHKKFSVSLAEGVMVNAPLELRFLIPFTIFHSYEAYKSYANYNKDLGHDANEKGSEPWSDEYDRIYDPTRGSRIGSYLGAKIEWQPLSGLRLYGLFAMDQFQLPVEESNWKESLTPNAYAFQTGFEVSIPAAGGYWDFGLEGVYTCPYMYVLWDKDWSFVKEVPEVDNIDHLRYWTGTPFGPDTIAGTLWGGFHSSDLWYAGLSFVFSARGERSETGIFETDDSITETYRPTHAVYDVTVPPTGIPVYTFTVSLPAKWKPLKWLDLSFRPGYRCVINTNHISGRNDHGFEITLSAAIKPPF